MSIKALDQPVRPNDLILIHGPNEAHMLVVTSVPRRPNPNTASVIVRNVKWHIPALNGWWVFDGPDVYYMDDENLHGENARYCLCEWSHSNDGTEDRLDCFLDRLEAAAEDLSVMIKPHGRYVFVPWFSQGEIVN